MALEFKTLDQLMAEDEERNRDQRAAELAKYDSPEEVAKREARRKAEFETGVRLGWHDENGEPIADETDEDETDEDEQEGQNDD